jgi:hypothetical protein
MIDSKRQKTAKHLLFMLGGVLLIAGCSSQQPAPGATCTTKILSKEEMKHTKRITYKEEIPQDILSEKSKAQLHKEDKHYLFDDTPIGNDLENDSGSFLNQQKRQSEIQRELHR